MRLAVVGAGAGWADSSPRWSTTCRTWRWSQRLGSTDPLAFAAGVDAVVDVTLPHISPGRGRRGDVSRAAGPRRDERLDGGAASTSLRAGRARGAARRARRAQLLASARCSRRGSPSRRPIWFESIEIVEAHHAGKADSPSGTAVATAERIAAARAELGPVAAPHTDQRARGQQVGSVPIHSLRMDGVQAKQDVLFGGTGELLTIRHETVSPSAYAAGIRLAVLALPGLTGVTVGLESLLFG